MFQQLKKLSQSSNTTVIDNNHYIFPIPPVSLLDLSDRTLDTA